MEAEFEIPAEVKNVKVVVRPSVLDNNIHWKEFDSDEQIIIFLIKEAKFSVSNYKNLKQQYGDKILQLKSNKLPKGLVTLEYIFNSDDQV